MSFRGRILLACMLAATAPLALFAFGARREVQNRLTIQFEERRAAATAAVRADLETRSRALDVRLAALAERIGDEPAVRAALVLHDDRSVLIDYAPRVMPASGLDYLLLADGDGTVLSAGHFRADHSRTAPALRPLLTAPDAAIVTARTVDGEFLALARSHAFTLGDRQYVLTGGFAVDSAFVASLVRDPAQALTITLDHPRGQVAAAPPAERTAVDAAALHERIDMAFIDDAAGDAAAAVASWTIHQSLAPLHAVRRGIDRWLLAAIAAALLLAWLIARLLAARVNRPLEELARRSTRVNLDRLDATFATRRTDEIGSLSRTLDAMVQRLRAAATQLRTAERRATVGDMARQVNHDIRNGLVPIRNVIGHLSEVAETAPAELGTVFADRAGTLHGGVAYLESLATSYARLTPPAERQLCDVNAAVRACFADIVSGSETRVVLELHDAPLRVRADPVSLRRVIENLAVNAIDSLDGGRGTVTVRTCPVATAGASHVLLSIADSGHGIDAASLDRIFDDFHTTKPHGSGLGLSIVRRLVADMGGRIRVESEVGRGTTFTLEIPEAA